MEKPYLQNDDELEELIFSTFALDERYDSSDAASQLRESISKTY